MLILECAWEEDKLWPSVGPPVRLRCLCVCIRGLESGVGKSGGPRLSGCSVLDVWREVVSSTLIAALGAQGCSAWAFVASRGPSSSRTADAPFVWMTKASFWAEKAFLPRGCAAPVGPTPSQQLCCLQIVNALRRLPRWWRMDCPRRWEGRHAEPRLFLLQCGVLERAGQSSSLPWV